MAETLCLILSTTDVPPQFVVLRKKEENVGLLSLSFPLLWVDSYVHVCDVESLYMHYLLSTADLSSALISCILQICYEFILD